MPKITVAIPTHNRSRMLAEELARVLRQDFGDFELLVLDNASTDDTAEVVANFKDKRIRYLPTHAIPPLENWNRAFGLATGEYVIVTHDDDLMNPGFLEAAARMLDSHPELVGVATCVECVGPDGKVIQSRFPTAEMNGDLHFSPGGYFRLWLTKHRWTFTYLVIPVTTFMLRRGLVKEHRLRFKPEFGYPADQLFICEANLAGGICLLAQPLFQYRRHAAQSYENPGYGRETFHHFIEVFRYLAEFVKTRPEYRDLEPFCHRNLLQWQMNLFCQEFDRGALDSKAFQTGAAALRHGLGLLEDSRKRVLGCAQANSMHPLYDTFAKFAVTIQRLLDRQPRDEQVLQLLAQGRRDLTQLIATIPPEELEALWRGELQRAHRLMRSAPLCYQPETDDITTLLSQFAATENEARRVIPLLQLMLYRFPHQLGADFADVKVPAWFEEAWAEYCWQKPAMFSDNGDAAAYFAFVEKGLRVSQADLSGLKAGDTSLKALAQLRAQACESGLSPGRADFRFAPKHPNGKIRLGILVARLSPASDGCAVLPVFEHLCRDDFDVVLYVASEEGSAFEQYCMTRAARFVLLPDGEDAQVQLIRDDELDILFFGADTTAGARDPVFRLGLYRLARVQASLPSAESTTGLRHMDYFISGKLSEPDDAPAHYSEKLFCLEGSGACFNFRDIRAAGAARPERKDFGVAESEVVFAARVAAAKTDPSVYDCWLSILKAVPQSVLLLAPLAENFSGELAAPLGKWMDRRCLKLGVDSQRVVIHPNLPNREDAKQALRLADVYLDSFPCGCVAGLTEALETGLPCVVLEGRQMRARRTAALLREANLGELVTEDVDAYRCLAVCLGTAAEERTRWRQNICAALQAPPHWLDSRKYSARIAELCRKMLGRS